MSLDGTFLHCVVSEMLSAGLVGGRIDKVYQPSREEIIISIRSAGKHNKILISSNSMSARVGMTEGKEHKINRLIERHHITRHLWYGYSHWLTFLYLIYEERND